MRVCELSASPQTETNEALSAVTLAVSSDAHRRHTLLVTHHLHEHFLATYRARAVADRALFGSA